MKRCGARTTPPGEFAASNGWSWMTSSPLCFRFPASGRPVGSLDRCRRQDSRRCQGNARDRPDAARALAARPSGMSGRLWGAFLPPLFGWVTLGVAMGLLPVVVLLYAIVMLACTETVNRLLRDVAPGSAT